MLIYKADQSVCFIQKKGDIMKQQEKSEQSREKIIHAAIAEFGDKGYEGASLNTLLTKHGISKGMVYHYFKSKDEIYISCVKLCFDSLTKEIIQTKAYKDVESYFEVRGHFFLEYPSLARIFFDAIHQPPKHLELEINAAKVSFEATNLNVIQTIFKNVEFHKDINYEDTLQYFMLMQNALHIKFMSMMKEQPYANIVHLYEKEVHKMINILLYGIMRRD